MLVDFAEGAFVEHRVRLSNDEADGLSKLLNTGHRS